MQNCRGIGSNSAALCPPHSLRSLQLESCNIGWLPADWPAVARLTELSLANNPSLALRKCIAVIDKAPQLRCLDWSYNRLPTPEPYTGLATLDRLGLRRFVPSWTTAEVIWVANVARANTRLKFVTKGKGPLWRSEEFEMAFDYL